MRLGGPVFEKTTTMEEWAHAHRKLGYAAAFAPEIHNDAEAHACREAAEKADLVIAEVGAWSNPLSLDPAERRKNIDYCARQLALADLLGAKCCVNIAGSLGSKWDGPDPRDLTDATFDLIVEVVREIIDLAKPRRSAYTLEPMPWMYPDSAESYLKLVKAIDRKAFGVHFDPVNMINCPARYFRNGEFIRDFVKQLAPHIRSVHAKDTLMHGTLTVRLDEVRPGLGTLDYCALLTSLEAVDPQLSILVEHLPNEQEYDLAVQYVRLKAAECGVRLI